MDLQEVLNDLKKRFQADYPEFYNRRIVVWTDQDREFEDVIDEIAIDGVKVLKMSDDNMFLVKKTLCCDDPESDYLLYCPLYFQRNEDNWLTDVFKYSEEFRADRVSMEMAEMDLKDTVSIRREVKRYSKFFNAKKRRDDVRKLSGKIDTAGNLILAIMCSIAKCPMEPDTLIREVIKAGMEKETNPIYQEFVNYEIQDSFWSLCLQGTGYTEEDREIGNLFTSILLTAATRTIGADAFIGLDGFIHRTHDTFCFQFIEDWMRDSKENASFRQLSKTVEDQIQLYERLLKLDLADYVKSEFFLAVDEAVLYKLMKDIENDIIDPEEILETVEARRVKTWYQDFSRYYEGLYYMAKIKDFYNRNQDAFHEISPEKLWQAYADDFYRMDTYYRKFQQAFQKSLNNPLFRLDDGIKAVAKRAEGIYQHWFLDKLLANWCNIAGNMLETRGYIPQLPQQKDFYRDNIRDAKTKMFVIISDAMRYEVAKELSEDLVREMQCKVEMRNMEGIFPTITPFGMAALLPKEEMELEAGNGTVTVLDDGEPTGANYREKVLRKANPASVVLKYEELIQLRRDERKAKVKGMEVIYIYHDRIDAAGHGSGHDVFTACDEAIDEVKNLVRIIVNDFSGVNILITSDHGFIYTYDAFTEADKVEKIDFSGTVDCGRRYAIMEESAQPQYLMPVKLFDENSGLKGFTPRENIRIKNKGGAINFVHGGISLQEKMVPLVAYRHLRNDNKEYQRNRSKIDVKPVELKLLSEQRTISNMIFNMSFYQSEMLSETREASSFILYFVDEYDNRISDEVRIIADRNNPDDETDRRFEERFNLKAGNYDGKKSYYLMIIEESNKVVPEKIEFSIDIPFATGEYDFFS